MKKTFYKIIHETKQGQTFSIKFTKKNGEVREYKDCTIWHEYAPSTSGHHAGLSSKENWKQHRKVMFWANDVNGYRMANEDAIIEVKVNE